MANDTPSPPPPPDDPYPPLGNGDPGSSYTDGLEQARPSVAANPGRVLLVVGVVGVVLAVLLYNVFFGKRDKDDEKKEPLPTAPVAQVAPPPPPPVETPVFTPPPVPEPAKVEVIQPEDDSAARAQLRARLHSNMLIADQGGAAEAGGAGNLFGSNEIASEDPNLQFQSQVVRANSKAERTQATHIGDLHRTIAQGRLIQATLESAINTELPAPIRAIVSRDTFGEAGTEPLIPKGSRLIGQYTTDLAGGQSRVFVVWTRVIRPDGVDVALGSPLVDRIGQAGVGGQVDNKFQQIFSRSIMASIISIGFAIGVEAVNPSDGGSSTTNSTFGTTQSGDAASTATINALNRLGSTTESFLQRFINTRPTILVDQGTPVNVFVNRDLIFPGHLAGPQMVN